GATLSAPLTVFGGYANRIFEIEAGAELELVGLILWGGSAPDGADGNDGAIPTPGDDGGNGGAIYNEGRVTLVRCELQSNIAGYGGKGGDKWEDVPGSSGNGGRGGHGGAIFSTGADALVRLEDSIIEWNDAGQGGAAGDRSEGAVGSVGAAGEGG